jgi:predicted aspartyl protease
MFIAIKIHVLFIFFCLSLITVPHGSVAQFGFEFENKKNNRVFVPFEMYNNLIIVPVKLNNRAPLKFIVDTGIRTTILTEKIVADVLNLSLTRQISLKGPGEKQIVAAHVANNVNIKLPGIVGKSQSILVLEEDFLQLRNHLGIDVQGIIGYELFSRFVVEIDYRNHILIFHRSSDFKPRRRFTRFDLAIEDTKPYLQTELVMSNGDTVNSKLMLDTGASHALMLEEDDESGVIVPDEYIDACIGRGLGGPIMGRLGRIGSIGIGDYVLKDVIASFPKPGNYVDPLFYNRHGTMGGELLSRFRVIFDYSTESLYLRRNPHFRRGFEFDMSGVEVMAIGPKLQEFVVINLHELSPAQEAGLKVGDKIQYINGIKSDNLKLNQFFRLFHSKPGRTIRMIVNRNGQEHKIKFKLKRFI